MMSLKNKIVFVTGASSGIGRSCARAFAREGASILMAARRAARLKELAKSLAAEYGVPVHSFVLDVRDPAEVARGLEALPDEWKAVDVLVNNAGLSRGLNKLQEGLISDWEEMIDTNVKGLLYVSRAVLPGMVARGRGHVINIGSIAGHELYPGRERLLRDQVRGQGAGPGLAAGSFGNERPGQHRRSRDGRNRVQRGPLPRGRRAGGEGLSGADAAFPGRCRRGRPFLRDPAAARQRQRGHRHADGSSVGNDDPSSLSDDRNRCQVTHFPFPLRK